MVDPLAHLAGYVLRRASIASIGRLHRQLAEHDLRVSEASMLILIGSDPGLTQSDAGRILGIKRANMVPLTARLEARGLVERSRLTGRSQKLALTEAGREMLAKVHAVTAAHEAEALARVPEHLRPHVLPVLMALWAPGSDDD